MAVTLIGGNGSGVLDSSLTLFTRNERTGTDTTGSGESLYVNVANGVFIIQHRDAYLPSLGADFNLVRTYNSRGSIGTAGNLDAQWELSTGVTLRVVAGGSGPMLLVTYGDGSEFAYSWDAARQLYVSNNGTGAFETIQDFGSGQPRYVLTQADQTRLYFSDAGDLLRSVDARGVRMEYVYSSGRLQQVLDDQGHRINFVYDASGQLIRITDDAAGVLVEYRYASGRLSDVMDRMGHVTHYEYSADGLLNRIVLPASQDANGDGVSETYASRIINLEYGTEAFPGAPTGSARVVRSITDAEGGVTTFGYAFDFPGGVFDGGTTRVVDALGNNRAYSNDAAYRQWRVANGFYDIYDPSTAATNPAYQTQVNTILTAHSLSYSYQSNGYITELVDQQGFRTLYSYDSEGNLTSVTDRNGWGVLNSDSSYYRALRAELGYVDASGNGRLVATLSANEQAALRETFTSHFRYDSSGNLLEAEDNNGSITRFTYTSFNKVASTTTPSGRTTLFFYDANQNLIEQRAPSADLTRFDYDGAGNRTRRIVFLDANDLLDPAKQQITQYFHDAYGNVIETVDAEGNHSLAEYDLFGNLIRLTDGRSGVTSYTYDADSRLLTVTDAEGNTTVNTYDAVGNRISVTDARGKTTYQFFDRNNRLITVLNPSDTDTSQNRVTQYTYDVVGNQTSSTDAEGRTTTYIYDARRELVELVTAEVAGAGGTPVRYRSFLAYDGQGNRISTTDNNGYTTSLLYNEDGMLVERKDPNGHVTRYAYDANNNQVSIVAGMQLPPGKRQTLRFSYDEEDQLEQEIDAEGHAKTYTRDAIGNIVSVQDQNGNRTDYQFDRSNRLVREMGPPVVNPATGLAQRYVTEHRYDANGNEVELIDANGDRTLFRFDRNNRRVLVTDANGINTVYSYDGNGNRTSIQIGVDATIDANGRVSVTNVDNAQVTTFAYDEFNQLVSRTDGVGNALASSNASLYRRMRVELGYSADATLLSAGDQQALRSLYTAYMEYDRVGNRTEEIDNLRRVTQFSYDALNRQQTATDAAGGVSQRRYDGNGNVVSITDALNHATTFAYDSRGLQITQTDAAGVTTAFEFDEFGNLLAEKHAAGTTQERVSRYVYDLNNRVIAQTDAEGFTERYEYDAIGNRLRVIDRRGGITQTFYDALNRTVRVIDAKSFESRFEYDGVGNRIALIDKRGAVVRLVYDAGNRLIETTDAQRRVTRYTYNALGDQIEVRTAVGTAEEQVSIFEYDALHNLRRVVDGTGNATVYGYDRIYNRVSTVDGNGNLSTSEFDALNRLVRITNAEGESTAYKYDAVSNQLEKTDGNGRITSWAYDAVNRVIREVAANGIETHYAYDAVGNSTAITQAANSSAASTTTFTYDRNNRLVTETNALGFSTSYSYDANGNRTIVTDARGFSTIYTYDANNRVTHIQDPLGNVVQYRYDGNGNRVQVIDARGFATTRYFNSNNEAILDVDAEGYATARQYDNNGNVISQTLRFARVGAVDPNIIPSLAADPRDQLVRFEYDAANRLTARVDAEEYRTEYRYDAVGNRVQTRQFRDRSGPDIATTQSFYDRANRVTDEVSAAGYLTQYVYDDVGNVLSRTIYDQRALLVNGKPQPAAGDPGRVSRFTYDAVYRVLTETDALNVVTRFEYDARGNQIAITEAFGTADSRRTGFAYDTANRLTDIIDALGITTHYVLDANGNIVDRYDAYGTAAQRRTQRTYNGKNQQVREQNALGFVTELQYDATGNLSSHTYALGRSEQRTERFEYDRNNRVVAQINGAGERTESIYDAAGNRIRLTVGAGRPEQRVNYFEFDRDNRLIAATDGVGIRTEYRYNGADQKIETIQAVGVAGAERHTFYTYDLDGRIVRVIDPMGAATSYEYDVLGNQTRVINANGGVQTNTFDALGRSLTSLSAGNVLTVNVYDLRGNVVRTTQSFSDGSDARTTHCAYDVLDRRVATTDGEGFTTSVVYDAFGNQVSITNGQYLLTPSDLGYDAAKAGRAHVQTNSFTFDAANRLLSAKDGAGNVTTYTFDAIGNRTSVTEASNSNARTTQYRYDLANRLIETVTPESGIVINEYNAAGNRVIQRTLQSNAGGIPVWIVQHFEYDGNGRATAAIDPYGVRTEYDYDAIGNTIAVRGAARTASERTVRMLYDLNNRKVADIDGEGNTTSYAYDASGNRVRTTDALGRIARYYFDRSNRLIAVLDPEGVVNRFVYDSAGNAIENRLYAGRFTGTADDWTPPVVTSSSDDRVTSTTYDQNSRAIRIVEPDGSTTAKTYDASGNVLTEQLYVNTGAPRTRSYAYDLNNRLSLFTDVDGTVTEFGWDAANNKVSERIVSTTDPNAVRETIFVYDLNNRLIQQIFDPNGLAIVETTHYDKVGNVVASVDGNGHTTIFAYDLANRITVETDALGNAKAYEYDAVGNRIAITDARKETTRLFYDRNNRLVLEQSPVVGVYDPRTNSFSSTNLTTRHIYDALGNEVQTHNPDGGITTRYFDASGHKVAEVTADNVLIQWRYNAFGEVDSETLYMTRLTKAAHDPNRRPSEPAGDSRTTQLVYDRMGRVTRRIFPQIAVTTIVINASGQPTPTVNTVRPEERSVYDAFGNAVEKFDKNGNRTVAYYDVKDRLIAQVDAEGYLIESDYDAQDNVLEQRTYAGKLNPSSVRSTVRPTPPAGEVHTVSRRYDAANRLISEYSPYVEVLDSAGASGFERVLTTFRYDKVGNVVSRTRSAETSQANIEYYYFDAANRQVAVINANRVLHTLEYDANGNVTRQTRYYNAVSPEVDLTSLSGDSTNFHTLVRAHANDQITARLWDAGNRLTTETDLMSNDGGADDITKVYRYSALGQQTWARNGDGRVTRIEYDLLGRVVRNIAPDGTASVINYDAAGNQIFLYTGLPGTQALPAENVTATYGSNLVIGWDLPASVSQRSWIVWDTSTRANLADYKSKSAELATWYSEHGQVYIPADDFHEGSEIYFRVVTADASGNIAYTSERVVRLPPRLQTVSVERIDDNSVRVHVTAPSTAQNLVLYYGPSGSMQNAAGMTQEPDGSYTAIISGVSNFADLAFLVSWTDDTGNNYDTGEISLQASGEHLGVITSINESTTWNGQEVVHTLTATLRVPASLAQRLASAVAFWQNLDTAGAPLVDTGVAGQDNGDGTWSYVLTIGAGSQALVAGNYRIVLSGVFANPSSISSPGIILDQWNVQLGTTSANARRQSVSWPAANVGNANAQGQIVLINGEVVPSARDSDSQQLTALVRQGAGTLRYDALYGELAAEQHRLTVSSASSGSGYNVGFTLDLDPKETSRAVNGVRIAYRPAGSGVQFSNNVSMSQSRDRFTATLSRLPAGSYDAKVYYIDANGREVILDWLRFDAQSARVATTSRSLTLLASEINGSLRLGELTLPQVTPGLFLGDVDYSRHYLELALGETGRPGGTVSADGRTTGYFIENRWNALNQLIGTNSDTGLWREFGVDANGNRVATYEYGAKGNTTFHDSFALFDGRNRKTADYSVATAVYGSSTAQRSITRYGYDVFDNQVEVTDARNNTTLKSFNAVGLLLRERDRLGATTLHSYDRLGNQTRTIDALGNQSYKAYDLSGRLIQEVNGAGDVTEYGYDTFDRKVEIRRVGGPQITSFVTFDHHDRITNFRDGLNHVTNFTYDKRDNRTGVQDANGNWTYQEYDDFNRVTATRYFQNGTQIVERRQYDSYGNLIAEIDGAGRVRSTTYGAFGHKLAETESTGRQLAFEYDVFGNLIREYRPASESFTNSGWNGGLGQDLEPWQYAELYEQWQLQNQPTADIRRDYDAAGRIIRVSDAKTGTTTTYSYDLNGNRMQEDVTGTGGHDRHITYGYDAENQTTRWFDGVTGMHLNYLWDAAGNQKRVYTDASYANAVDHWYEFDGANRVTAERRGPGGSIINGYEYDALGNRNIWNNAGIIVTYQFDNAGRVISGFWVENGASWTSAWAYDNVGNVLTYATQKNGNVETATTSQYTENNLTRYTNSDGQETHNTYDAGQRLTGVQIVNDGKTRTFSYNYFADGRQSSIVGQGNKNAAGTSRFTYDVNDRQVRVDKGQGDGMDRPEYLTFVYDNDGKILFRFHDEGTGSDRHNTEFAYANGSPVGERKNQNGTITELLDTGKYNLLPSLGEDFPDSSVSAVTVADGDTLISIAARVYGNPSLWFVLAEANGLDPSQQLKIGARLLVPNSIESGAITADTHVVYNESDIIGSTLPNLKTPKKKNCASLVAIIIIVVIAVVATIATSGLAGALLAGGSSFLGLTGAAATITAYAVAGAVVGAAASIVQQGIFIALKFQDKFSWKELAASTVAGAFSGAAQGVGKAVELGQKVIAASSTYAHVAAAALKVSGEASKQLISNGKITSWASLAAAAIAPTRDSLTGKEIFRGLGNLDAKTVSMITPWLSIAETYVEGDQPTVADWVSAASSTLGLVIKGGADDTPVEILATNLGRNLMVAGAVFAFDEDAARSFLEQSVGQEVGNFLGVTLADRTNLKGWALQADEAFATEVKRQQLVETIKAMQAARTEVPNVEDLQAKARQPPGSVQEFNLEEYQQGLLSSIRGDLEDEGLGRYEQLIGVLEQTDINAIFSALAHKENLKVGVDSVIAEFMYALGLGGTTPPLSMGSVMSGGPSHITYSEKTLFKAAVQLQMALSTGLGASLDLPAHIAFVREKDASKEDIRKAVEYYVGGRADAVAYMDIIDRIDDISPTNRLINITYAYAQSDARATLAALNKSYVAAAERMYRDQEARAKSNREAYDNADWWERGGLATQQNAMSLSVFGSSMVRDYAVDIAYSGDKLAPAKLRNDARASLFFEAALTFGPALIGLAKKGVKLINQFARLNRFRSAAELGAAVQRTAALNASSTAAQRRLVSDAFLSSEGVASPAVRQQILDAGFDSAAISATDTPATYARFRKLFPDTVNQGKAFKGRLGNLFTRIAEIEYAAQIERSGLLPVFEYEIPVQGQARSKRFVDLVSVDRTTGQVRDYYQFVKADAAGTIFRFDEYVAAYELEQMLGLQSGTIELINTFPVTP